jgi:hypothetical protein
MRYRETCKPMQSLRGWCESTAEPSCELGSRRTLGIAGGFRLSAAAYFRAVIEMCCPTRRIRLHRQRHDLLVQLANKVESAGVLTCNVGQIGADRNAALGGASRNDLPHWPWDARHGDNPVALGSTSRPSCGSSHAARSFRKVTFLKYRHAARLRCFRDRAVRIGDGDRKSVAGPLIG